MQHGGAVVLLFILAALVAIVAGRLKVPYTVALVVAGLALSAADVVLPLSLSKELLYDLFLPGLIFEAAFHLEAEEFWANRLSIFTLALPGVLAATVITALILGPALLWGSANTVLGGGAALVFAALIGATDPIAVVSIVRTLGAPPRLSVLIEGESLLNDGTAAVFFAVAVTYVLGVPLNTASVIMDVIYGIGGAVIVGGAIALALGQVIGRLDDRMLQITLTTIGAYGSFVAAERVGASGVIATVTAGLLLGSRASLQSLSPTSRVAVGTFWEYVAFAFNSLVFLLIGFQVSVSALLVAWRPILLAYAVVTVGRIGVTYGIVALLPRAERIPPRWTAVLSWSGLRGALAMVLALSLPDRMPQRDLIILMTFGVAVVSILVQGLTVNGLIRWLGVASNGEAMPPGVRE
jgi:CPA1 family monovalent cation:H+ antiporter